MTKKILIGYGYTNNNGVATLDYDANGTAIYPSGYSGNGSGLLQIKAEMHDDGTVQSEPYTLWDTLFFDNGGTSVNKWDLQYGSGLQISYPNNEYTKIEGTHIQSSSQTYMLSTEIINGDFEATLEVVIPSYVSNVGQYFGFRDTSFQKQTVWRATQNSWRYYKIRKENNVWTGYVKVNESDEWQTIAPTYDTVTNENVYFCFTIYNPTDTAYAIGFKNLKIYPI